MAQTRYLPNNILSDLLLIIISAGALLISTLEGGAVLSIFAAFLCLMFLVRDGVGVYYRIFPFLFVLFCSYLAQGVFAFDGTVLWRGLRASCAQESCLSFVPVAGALYASLARSITSYVPLIVSLLLIAALSVSPERYSLYKKGVIGSSVLSLAIMLCQYSGILPPLHAGNWHYWESISRFPGILADPNALGVASYLVVSILFAHFVSSGNRLILPNLCGWIFLGLVSGSRTFILGCVVAGAVALFQSKRKVFWISLVIAVCSLTILYLLDMPDLEISWLPLGIRRVIETASESGGFFSRKVFWHASLSMWSSNPLTGIGAGQFLSAFPRVSRELGYSLQGWTDNTNSFYLQILVDFGLLGFVGFLLAASSFRISPGKNLEKAFIAGFLVQLAVGPHLQFIEVALLAPLLIVPGTMLREGSPPNSMIYLSPGLIMLCLMLMSGSSSPRGVIVESPETLWVVRDSRFSIYCSQESISLMLQSPYASHDSPVRVQLSASTGAEHSLLLSKSDTIPLQLVCAKEGDRFIPVKVAVECSRFWLPHVLHQKGDLRPRCLSVKVAGGSYG